MRTVSGPPFQHVNRAQRSRAFAINQLRRLCEKATSKRLKVDCSCIPGHVDCSDILKPLRSARNGFCVLPSFANGLGMLPPKPIFIGPILIPAAMPRELAFGPFILQAGLSGFEQSKNHIVVSFSFAWVPKRA